MYIYITVNPQLKLLYKRAAIKCLQSKQKLFHNDIMTYNIIHILFIYLFIKYIFFIKFKLILK